MSENEAIQFFTKQTVAVARSLPLADAILFLRGALIVAESSEVMTPFRAAYQQLQAADNQLELIRADGLEGLK